MRTFLLFTIGIIYCLCFVFVLNEEGCTTSTKEETTSQKTMPSKDINDVMNNHVKELMSVSGVVGVYIGAKKDSALCIRVMVKQLSEEITRKIPESLEGHPIEIEVSGEIKPMH